MKPLFLVSLLCFAGVGLNRADDAVIKELRVPNTTIGERILTNVRVIKEEPDGLRVSHDAGISKIPYEQLPAELKNQFKFDPEAAAAFRAKALNDKRAPVAAPEEKKAPVVATEEVKPAAPAPIDLTALHPITMMDVKNKWLASLDEPVPGLDLESVQKRAHNEQLRRAIVAGEHDLKAQKYAHEYNAWLYNQRGEKEAADQEQAAIVEIEKIEASNRLADATARNADATARNTEAVGQQKQQQQRETRIEYIDNPYPVNQFIYVPTPVYSPNNQHHQHQQQVINQSGITLPNQNISRPPVVTSKPPVTAPKPPFNISPTVQPQPVLKSSTQPTTPTTTTRRVRKPGDPNP